MSIILPKDVWRHILSFVQISDLMSLKNVSKELNALVYHEYRAHFKCTRQLPASILRLIKSKVFFRSIYVDKDANDAELDCFEGGKRWKGNDHRVITYGARISGVWGRSLAGNYWHPMGSTSSLSAAVEAEKSRICVFGFSEPIFCSLCTSAWNDKKPCAIILLFQSDLHLMRNLYVFARLAHAKITENQLGPYCYRIGISLMREDFDTLQDIEFYDIELEKYAEFLPKEFVWVFAREHKTPPKQAEFLGERCTKWVKKICRPGFDNIFDVIEERPETIVPALIQSVVLSNWQDLGVTKNSKKCNIM